MDVEILDTITMGEVRAMGDFFGYDCVIDGDEGTVAIYCGNDFLYKKALA